MKEEEREEEEEEGRRAGIEGVEARRRESESMETKSGSMETRSEYTIGTTGTREAEYFRVQTETGRLKT